MAAQHRFRPSQRRQQAKAWPHNATDTQFHVSDKPRIGPATTLSPSASPTGQSMAAQHHFRPSQRRRRAKTWPSNTADELSGAKNPRHSLMPTRFSLPASLASHGLACSRRHHLHQRVHLSHFIKHTVTRGRPHIRTAHSQHTTTTHIRKKDASSEERNSDPAQSIRHQVITGMQ